MEEELRYFLVGFNAIKNNNEAVASLKSIEAACMPTHKAVIDFITETNPEFNKIALVSLTELSKEDYNTFTSEI
jgi:hypothetical protein